MKPFIEKATDSFLNQATSYLMSTLLTSFAFIEFINHERWELIIYTVLLLFIWIHTIRSQRLRKKIEALKFEYDVDRQRLRADLNEYLIGFYRPHTSQSNFTEAKPLSSNDDVLYPRVSKYLFEKNYRASDIQFALDVLYPEFVKEYLIKK